MGKDPIRCGFMCPLLIAPTQGQNQGEMGFVAILGKTAKIHPKLVPPKIVSPYHKRKEPWAFAWMQTEALLPFCNKG